MPQLDKFSFATQLFWFCSLFIAFYLVIIQSFLPKFLKIIRYRTHRLLNFSVGVRSYLIEELLIVEAYTNMVTSSIIDLHKYLSIFNRVYFSWVYRDTAYLV